MSEHLRPSVRAMAGYVPGEQPRDNDVIKLNTNENPYPPSPRVMAAIKEALQTGQLQKYPDPLGTVFCERAGLVLDVDPECILIGNGSDDILTIVTRAFVPEGGLVVAPTPSYTLYRTLAEIQGARFATVPFTENWQLPAPWPKHAANLTLVPNPNSPSGTIVSAEDLCQLADQIRGPLVIDEAYVDFAAVDALSLRGKENIVITRSLSKSYSLAGLRFGFGVANPELIRQLLKVKDSYNCDVLSLAAATAALEDQDYLQQTRTKILHTRQRLQSALIQLGFNVVPSQANFVWCTHRHLPAKPIYEQLKQRQVLVRYMNFENYSAGLRISVGADEEIDRLLEELARVV